MFSAKEKTMYDVICAGQAIIDCIIKSREEKPYKENVFRAKAIELHTGGDALNEAMALSSMGYDAALVCGLGNDLAGSVIIDESAKYAIDTERVRIVRGMPTPVANLNVADDGSRHSVNSPATDLNGYSIAKEDLAGAKIVSFASLFRPPFADLQYTADLIKYAKAQGSVICADSKLPLSEGKYIEHLGDALPMIDYFFPNEKEAAYYSNKASFEEAADFFRNLGIKNVIIKAGAEGCFVSGTDGTFTIPAVTVDDVVDTTGAGDNFVAGFISGLLKGEGLYDCALLGTQRAAYSITHTGGNF